MKRNTQCIHTQQIECQPSLVFHFMRVAKWIALSLLLGIGFMGALLQFQRHQEINWMFFSVCIVCGVILFWIGHCIMKSDCAIKRRCGTCVKVSTVSLTKIRQV